MYFCLFVQNTKKYIYAHKYNLKTIIFQSISCWKSMYKINVSLDPDPDTNCRDPDHCSQLLCWPLCEVLNFIWSNPV
jgi:hypothetical protein